MRQFIIIINTNLILLIDKYNNCKGEMNDNKKYIFRKKIKLLTSEIQECGKPYFFSLSILVFNTYQFLVWYKNELMHYLVNLW